MLSVIREILIISTAEDLPNFECLLVNGCELGIELYKIINACCNNIY